MTPTFLFLLGTVAVACNGAIIKGKPCEHYSDEEVQAEPVLANIPEAPMLPPFSPSALQFVAPLQEEIKTEKPEATTSMPTVPMSYQPYDYAWPAPIYPNFPVNVLTGQAALDYPNVQIIPITDFTKPESQKKKESLAPIPEAPVLPAFEPGMVLNYSQTEKKEERPATPEVYIGAAPMLPSWTAPNFMPYPQMDESSAFYQQPYNYYPIAQRPCEHSSGASAAATPVLLPFYLPALAPQAEPKPASTWYPAAPILPSFSLSELPLTNAVAYDETPAKEDEKVDTVLMSIPEAPILPPFVAPEMPREEMTAAPMAVEMPVQNDAEAPCKKEIELIPEAPVLPAFVAPELYLSAPITEEPKRDEPVVFEAEPTYEYVPIPEAPVLPAFVAPEMPLTAEPEEPMKEEPAKEEPATNSEAILVIIPEAPVLSPFTAPMVLPIAAPMYDEVKPESAAPCEERKEETYENSAPVFIPTAPMLPPFVAPEMPKIEEEKESMPIATEAPAVPEPEQYVPIPPAPVLPTYVAPEVFAAPIYDEPKYEEPQQYIPIPAAPVLPTFEMSALPTYDEPKSEDCDKDKEHQREPLAYPYYLPIPAKYAVSSQSGPALPESADSIAECIRKILANRVSPAFYANLIPAAQDMRAPMVPAFSPFYYKPAMSNDLPVY